MRAEDVEGLTVGGLLDLVTERRPDDDAVVYPDRGLRYSYRRFTEVVEECASALMALGLKKGDHVAVWGQNVPEWLTLQFATGKMGAVLVTVNPAYKARELGYVLEQSDAAALFLTEGVKDADFLDVLRRAVPELAEAADTNLSLEELPYLKNVVLMGGTPPDDMPVMGWDGFVERSLEVSEDDLRERQASLDAGDIINMQYTSGTTGFPKGVQLTHSNIVKNAFHIGECMKLGPEDRVCIPVPFFHCFGCVLGTLNVVTHEGTMVPVETFDPLSVLEAVHGERCTALLGVPTMFIAELEHPDFEKYDTSSLRTGIMAGSPCPIEVMKKVVDVMGADEITIAYGQTESSPVITQTRTDDSLERRVSTVGRKIPEVEVKIVDVSTGEEVGPGEQGDLCTRGYHVMRGYYKMDDKTSEVIDEDGWLHTGDLAVMDEDGYVRITGRAKDMIIRGGENVYPREIEEFLYTHPGISDVQVYGVPDEKYGEQVAAAVIPKRDADLKEDEIRDFCRENIARFKVPHYVDFMEDYPMTASGKIQKYKLREAAVERHGLKAATASGVGGSVGAGIDHRTRIEGALKLIFQGIEKLKQQFPEKAFTVDGRLVGDIGEVIAALEYEVDLYGVQTPVHDGETSDGRKVQIKATFKDRLSLTVVPEFYLGLRLFEDGTYEEVFNGPGSVIAERFSHRSGFGEKQLSFPLAALQELSESVSSDQRVLRRVR